MNKRIISACGAAVFAFSLTGCSGTHEGTGSKEAASAEQLMLTSPDPWDFTISVDPEAKSEWELIDGVFRGSGAGMDGMITVTLLVDHNHISCLEITQDGETQGVGGYEAIRDGVYASLIDAAQGPEIDTVSGATITTAGVREAVIEALEQAGFPS